MYESPIKIIESVMDSFSKSLIKEKEDAIILEVHRSLGVDVDRGELLRALQYDRWQYDKGYADGRAESRWIPIEDEQKPKDRKRYFIAYVFGDSDMHFFGEAMYHAFEGNDLVDRPHFSNEGVDDMRVTHWMEIPKLPEPPKGE